MTRPARMSDVAALAGVSIMTVSRVLNANVKVSDKVHARVLEAVARLNYLPNEVARSLRVKRTRQIGIIVPNLYDPFFAVCAHAISLVAKQHEYSTVITTSDEDPDTEYTEAKKMLRLHIEGLVVIPTTPKSKLNDPELLTTPIVTLDRPVYGSSFDCVLVQNKRGAEMAVQHLIEHRHRHIAYLGLSRRSWAVKERMDGYQNAMKAAGLKPDIHIVSDSQSDMLQTVRNMMSGENRPTAVFTSNNLVTRNALHSLSALNMAIPQDVSVVGFDDFEMADIIKPAVTVIRQPVDILGRVAAELLFSRLSAVDRAEKQKRIVLPVELVVRASCGSHA